jgi:hypothetical protein
MKMRKKWKGSENYKKKQRRKERRITAWNERGRVRFYQNLFWHHWIARTFEQNVERNFRECDILKIVSLNLNQNWKD